MSIPSNFNTRPNILLELAYKLKSDVEYFERCPCHQNSCTLVYAVGYNGQRYGIDFRMLESYDRDLGYRIATMKCGDRYRVPTQGIYNNSYSTPIPYNNYTYSSTVQTTANQEAQMQIIKQNMNSTYVTLLSVDKNFFEEMYISRLSTDYAVKTIPMPSPIVKVNKKLKDLYWSYYTKNKEKAF